MPRVIDEHAGGRAREPVQERSRARVRRLEHAAERILATQGYESLTISRLTKAAAVPVGTLYQFFEDKDAIVERLAHRYIAETAALIDARLPGILELAVGSRLGAAYELFVEFYRDNPAYRAIRAARLTSPALQRADDANVSAAVEGIRQILTTGTRVRDGERVRSTSRTLQLVADALLHRAGELHPKGAVAFVTEAKRMLGLLEEDAIATLSKRAPS